MPRQSAVRRVPAAGFQHPLQPSFQFPGGDAQAALGDLAPLMAVAQFQARLQQTLYRSWEGQRRRGGEVRHLPTTLEQMGQTALMESQLESVVRRPAIVNQKSVVGGTQNLYRLLVS